MAFKGKPTKDVYNVLGEELQFLVSKLVACCIPSESQNEKAVPPPPAVISLLHELTVDADPLLLGYIRANRSYSDMEVSDEFLVFLLRLLKKFLADDSVVTVGITSQTLRVSFSGASDLASGGCASTSPTHAMISWTIFLLGIFTPIASHFVLSYALTYRAYDIVV
ncbi:hypothetical protein BHM03_00011277 [Ensete ventricosum]|nr:hypothetical protein BHM03_00011277 [Ensete ventricosum]